MNGPYRRLGIRQRIVLIVVTIILLIVFTTVGTRLIEVPERFPAHGWDWARSLAGGLLLVLASIVLTFLPMLIKVVWRQPANDDEARFVETVRRIGIAIRRPRRIVAAVVVMVVFAPLVWLVAPPEQPPALEEGEIVLMSGEDLSPSDPRSMLIDQWNRIHPKSPVRFVKAPGDTLQQHDFMVDAAEDKTDIKPDVYVLDIVWMSEFIANKHIRPLDTSTLPGATEDLFPNVLATCRDNRPGKDKEQLWALPFNTDVRMLFRRSDLPEVNEPNSWNDYLGPAARDTLTKVLATRGPDPIARPETVDATQLTDTEEILTVTALEAMWAMGSKVVAPDGTLTFNRDNSAVQFDSAAATAFKNLAVAASDPAMIGPDAKTIDADTVIERFGDGKSLFMPNWPVAFDKLTKRDQRTVPFRVAELPGHSVLGGQNLAVSARTTRPRAAQELVKFFTSQSSQLVLFEVGGLPSPRPSTYTKSTRPYAGRLSSTIDRAWSRPVISNYAKFSDEFRQGVRAALNNGGQLPPDLGQRLAAIINKR
jgi:multiple sugar transport system substrate-binding protein